MEDLIRRFVNLSTSFHVILQLVELFLILVFKLKNVFQLKDKINKNIYNTALKYLICK